MENIGNISGILAICGNDCINDFCALLTKWLQTKEFKKSEVKNEDFRTSQKSNMKISTTKSTRC